MVYTTKKLTGYQASNREKGADTDVYRTSLTSDRSVLRINPLVEWEMGDLFIRSKVLENRRSRPYCATD